MRFFDHLLIRDVPRPGGARRWPVNGMDEVFREGGWRVYRARSISSLLAAVPRMNRDRQDSLNLIAAAFNGNRRVPPPVNEPVRSYAPGSPERAELKARLAAMAGERIDIPLIIGGQEIRTGETAQAVMPHDHRHVLADWHKAVARARRAGDRRRARRRASDWADWPWEDRAAVFLKAAELLTTTWRVDAQRGDDARPVEDRVPGGDRRRLRARSTSGASTRTTRRSSTTSSRSRDRAMWNQLDYRPLEGFVYAVTPFNFTAIARQPAHRARADGQHGGLEAGVERDALARTTS